MHTYSSNNIGNTHESPSWNSTTITYFRGRRFKYYVPTKHFTFLIFSFINSLFPGYKYQRKFGGYKLVSSMSSPSQDIFSNAAEAILLIVPPMAATTIAPST